MILYALSLAVILLGVLTFSYTLLRLLKLQPERFDERLLVNLGFGWIVISLAVYFFGWLQELTPDMLFRFSVLVVIVGVPSWFNLRRDVGLVCESVRSGVVGLKRLRFSLPKNCVGILVLILIGVNLVLLSLASFTPPVGWDALNYHLSVPRIYLQNQGIVNLPTQLHSHFPLPVQFQYLFLMGIGDDIMAQALELVYFIALLVLINLFRRRFFPEVSYLLILVILFSIPVLLFTVPEAHTEIASAFYALTALYMFLVYQERKQSKYLLLSFILTGYLAATKYTNLPFLVIPLTLLIVMYVFEEHKLDAIKLFRALLLFMLSVLFALPWYLKTWFYTRNPFWPYFLSLFNSSYLPNVFVTSGGIPAIGEIIESGTGVSRWHVLMQIAWKALTKPWRMTFFPKQFGGDRPKVGPLLLGLAPTLLTISVKEKQKRTSSFYALLFCGLYFAVWLVTFHNTRYLVPIYPVLATLLAQGTQTLFAQRKYLDTMIQLILLGALGISTLTTIKLHHNKVPVALGMIGRDTYYRTLTHPLGGGPRIEEYPVSVWANQHLKADTDKVLILQGLFGYFLEVPYERGRLDAQSKYDYSQVQTVEDLSQMFVQNGITHIMARTPPQPRKEPIVFAEVDLAKLKVRTERGFQILTHEFIPRYTDLVFEENKIYLYEITSGR